MAHLNLLKRHLKLAQRRLRELLFDLFLEVDELKLYLRIDIALLSQSTACVGYNVTLGCAFLDSHVLLPILLSQLADAVQVVALGQPILLLPVVVVATGGRRSLLVEVVGLGGITAAVAAILLSRLLHLRFRLNYDLLPSVVLVLRLLVLPGRRIVVALLVRRWVKLVPPRRRERHRRR